MKARLVGLWKRIRCALGHHNLPGVWLEDERGVFVAKCRDCGEVCEHSLYVFYNFED